MLKFKERKGLHMAYELTKNLETGNAVIDNEHRELFQAVNRLLDACSKGAGLTAVEPAMEFLLQYVDKHFAHEEELQENSKYPNMATHKDFHEKYKIQLKQIAADMKASGSPVSVMVKLNNHIAVLINHIRLDDKKLSTFLNQA